MTEAPEASSLGEEAARNAEGVDSSVGFSVVFLGYPFLRCMWCDRTRWLTFHTDLATLQRNTGSVLVGVFEYFK